LSPAMANLNYKKLLLKPSLLASPNLVKRAANYPPQSSSAPSDTRRRLLASTIKRVEENYTCSYKENDELEYSCHEYGDIDVSKCGPEPKWNCRLEHRGCLKSISGPHFKCVMDTLYTGVEDFTCAEFEDLMKGKILSDSYHPGGDCDMSTNEMTIHEQFYCDSTNNYAGVNYMLNLTSGRDPTTCIETDTCESATVGKHGVKCSILEYVADRPPPPSPPPAGSAPYFLSFTYRYFDNPSCEGEAKATESVEPGKRSTIPSWYIPGASGTNYMSIDNCKGTLCIVDSTGTETCKPNEFSYEKFCQLTSDEKRSFNVKECVAASSSSAGTRAMQALTPVIVLLVSLMLTVFAK